MFVTEETNMRDGKIIIVDDNEAVWKALRLILSREFRTVIGISNPTLLPALLREDDVDLVLLDMNFSTGKQNGGEGLFWLDRIRERKNPPAVVLITAFADINLAVASLKKGAADFIVKPWENENLIQVVVKYWEERIRKTSKNTDETVKNGGSEVCVNSSEQLTNQLIDFLFHKYVTRYGKPLPRLTREAREKLNALLWNGNIQLVEQTIERALLLNEGACLDADAFYSDTEQRIHASLTLEEMEKQFIREVLNEKNGNLTLTAQQLRISRQTLYNKMKKYGLSQ